MKFTICRENIGYLLRVFSITAKGSTYSEKKMEDGIVGGYLGVWGSINISFEAISSL